MAHCGSVVPMYEGTRASPSSARGAPHGCVGAGADIARVNRRAPRKVAEAGACPAHSMLSVWLVASACAASGGTVYIMRHCSRATFNDLQGRGAPGFDHLDNYTAYGPIPDWGVPAAHCTARGREIVVGQGAALADELRSRTGGDLTRLRVVADSAARDQTTARDLLTGLGVAANASATQVEVEPWVFDPQKARLCPYPTGPEYVAAINATLRATPKPADLVAMLDEMQARTISRVTQSYSRTYSDLLDSHDEMQARTISRVTQSYSRTYSDLLDPHPPAVNPWHRRGAAPSLALQRHRPGGLLCRWHRRRGSGNSKLLSLSSGYFEIVFSPRRRGSGRRRRSYNLAPASRPRTAA